MTEIVLHGRERTRKHIVDNGRIVYLRREKYCAGHGWIDLLTVGGEILWHEQHSGCDRVTSSSKGFVKPRKAARNEPDGTKTTARKVDI